MLFPEVTSCKIHPTELTAERNILENSLIFVAHQRMKFYYFMNGSQYWIIWIDHSLDILILLDRDLYTVTVKYISDLLNNVLFSFAVL